jgi:hypothetical protein
MSTIDLSSFLNRGRKLSRPAASRRSRSAFSPAGLVVVLLVVVATAVVTAVLLSVRLTWSASAADVTRLQADLLPALAAEVDPFAVPKTNAKIEELPAQF